VNVQYTPAHLLWCVFVGDVVIKCLRQVLMYMWDYLVRFGEHGELYFYVWCGIIRIVLIYAGVWGYWLGVSSLGV